MMTRSLHSLLAAGLLLAAVLLFSACSGGAREALDLSTTLPSEAGLYRVTYTSDLDPAAINELHAWTVHIETAEGSPVEGADIQVVADMPEHGHGMPTNPAMTEELGGGDYRLDGFKYSMPGWWTLTLKITANGQSDQVTFNLDL